MNGQLKDQVARGFVIRSAEDVVDSRIGHQIRSATDPSNTRLHRSHLILNELPDDGPLSAVTDPRLQDEGQRSIPLVEATAPTADEAISRKRIEDGLKAAKRFFGECTSSQSLKDARLDVKKLSALLGSEPIKILQALRGGWVQGAYSQWQRGGAIDLDSIDETPPKETSEPLRKKKAAATTSIPVGTTVPPAETPKAAKSEDTLVPLPPMDEHGLLFEMVKKAKDLMKLHKKYPKSERTTLFKQDLKATARAHPASVWPDEVRSGLRGLLPTSHLRKFTPDALGLSPEEWHFLDDGMSKRVLELF